MHGVARGLGGKKLPEGPSAFTEQSLWAKHCMRRRADLPLSSPPHNPGRIQQVLEGSMSTLFTQQVAHAWQTVYILSVNTLHNDETLSLLL